MKDLSNEQVNEFISVLIGKEWHIYKIGSLYKLKSGKK